jgi:predicted RNase H-like HicB family nuclease
VVQVAALRPLIRANLAASASELRYRCREFSHISLLRFSRRGNICQETFMRYTVVLEQDKDGGYVASLPALPGCVSQGDLRVEALNNIREAIALYVEDCREAGDPIPTEVGKEFVEVEAA